MIQFITIDNNSRRRPISFSLFRVSTYLYISELGRLWAHFRFGTINFVVLIMRQPKGPGRRKLCQTLPHLTYTRNTICNSPIISDLPVNLNTLSQLSRIKTTLRRWWVREGTSVSLALLVGNFDLTQWTPFIHSLRLNNTETSTSSTTLLNFKWL